MPMCQKREQEIERELAAVMRELERQLSAQKPGPKKPEPAPLPLDQGK